MKALLVLVAMFAAMPAKAVDDKSAWFVVGVIAYHTSCEPVPSLFEAAKFALTQMSDSELAQVKFVLQQVAAEHRTNGSAAWCNEAKPIIKKAMLVLGSA